MVLSTRKNQLPDGKHSTANTSYSRAITRMEVKANTIESKIHVYTLADYQELESVNENAFFCRFSYKAATSEFKPDHVQVFCKCSMPYNPVCSWSSRERCKSGIIRVHQHVERGLVEKLKTAIRSGFVTNASISTSAEDNLITREDYSKTKI